VTGGGRSRPTGSTESPEGGGTGGREHRDERGDLQRIPVDFGALEDAFQSDRRAVVSYLHLETGAVIWRRLDRTDREALVRLEQDPHYMRIEPMAPTQQYVLMEQFVEALPDVAVAARLREEIRRKNPFRRFKDAIFEHPAEREAWIEFRARHVRAEIDAWLRSRGLVGVPVCAAAPSRATPLRPSSRAPVSALEHFEALLEGLSPYELRALLAVATFLCARAHPDPEPPTLSEG
jgi:hypothetical protein